MYRTCADDQCAIKLRRPDGAESDLADDHPDLAALAADTGLAGAGLSHNARRLALLVGSAYQVYHLDNGNLQHETEQAPAGERWQLVEWTPNRAVAILASTRVCDCADRGVATSYELTGPLGDGSSDADWLSIGSIPIGGPFLGGDGFEPIDVTRPVEDRERVTVLDTRDFSDQLTTEESLAGPLGVPEALSNPGGESVAAEYATKVFAPHGDELVVSALLMDAIGAVSETSPRLDLPAWGDDEHWEVLGLVGDGDTVALTRTTTGSSTLDVVLVTAFDTTIAHTLPADAEVLVPGGVLSLPRRSPT